jgi:hypothetical protein
MDAEAAAQQRRRPRRVGDETMRHRQRQGAPAPRRGGVELRRASSDSSSPAFDIRSILHEISSDPHGILRTIISS